MLITCQTLKHLLQKIFQTLICIHAIYDFLKFTYIKCDVILKTGMLFSHGVTVQQKMPRLKTENTIHGFGDRLICSLLTTNC